jgi:hypothetical protein
MEIYCYDVFGVLVVQVTQCCLCSIINDRCIYVSVL